MNTRTIAVAMLVALVAGCATPNRASTGTAIAVIDTDGRSVPFASVTAGRHTSTTGSHGVGWMHGTPGEPVVVTAAGYLPAELTVAATNDALVRVQLESVGAALNRASGHLDEAEYALASATASEIIRAEPASEAAHVILILSLVKQRRYEEAAMTLTTATEALGQTEALARLVAHLEAR